MAKRSSVQGLLYLLHISPPYRHAKHYLGWTEGEDPEERVAAHRSGHGSPLVRAAVAAGSTVTLQRTWHGTRDTERRIKNRCNLGRVCPACVGEVAWRREATGSVSMLHRRAS